jgi:hypothetical protein
MPPPLRTKPTLGLYYALEKEIKQAKKLALRRYYFS